MTEIYLNTQVAAETLNQLIPGESVAYWRDVLIDARSHERPEPFNIPVIDTGAGALYTMATLNRLAQAIRAIDDLPDADVSALTTACASY